MNTKKFIASSLKGLHFLFLGICLLYSKTGYAQLEPDTKNSEIISVELNFAQQVVTSGIRTAFEKNLDTAGVIVSGHQIINGLKAYARAPIDTTDLLSWKPIYAAVNEDRSFGFTTGPYLYYAKRNEKPVASGYYFSIWKKNQQQQFKLQFDGGVIHSDAKDDTFLQKLPSPVTKVIRSNSIIIEAVTATLNRFKEDFESKGDAAYQKHLSPKAILLRPNKPIYLNAKTFLMVANHQSEKKMLGVVKGGGYDRSNQFYYEYGNLSEPTAEQKAKYCGYYLRVWHLQQNGWKIIADVKQYK
jgi:hypothetical protein